MNEFWNEQVTEKSWKTLLELKQKLKFTILGGWAIYLYAHTHKSKDIDIIVDLNELYKIKKEYLLHKNERLKKYEIHVNEIDVDIYVPFYSNLILPISELVKNTTMLEGIPVIEKEKLLILKQHAEQERAHSIKGQKDRVDILSLLITAEMDWQKYNSLIEKYDLQEFKRHLKSLIQTAKIEWEYLNISNPREIKKLKKKFIEQLAK